MKNRAILFLIYFFVAIGVQARHPTLQSRQSGKSNTTPRNTQVPENIPHARALTQRPSEPKDIETQDSSKSAPKYQGHGRHFNSNESGSTTDNRSELETLSRLRTELPKPLSAEDQYARPPSRNSGSERIDSSQQQQQQSGTIPSADTSAPSTSASTNPTLDASFAICEDSDTTISGLNFFELIYQKKYLSGPGGGPEYYQASPNQLNDTLDELASCIQASIQCIATVQDSSSVDMFNPDNLENLSSRYEQILTVSRPELSACHLGLIEPLSKARDDCKTASQSLPVEKAILQHHADTKVIEFYKLSNLICGLEGTQYYSSTTVASATGDESADENEGTTEESAQNQSTAEGEEEPDREDEPVLPFESGLSESDLEGLIDSMNFATSIPDLPDVNVNSVGGSINFRGGNGGFSGGGSSGANFTPAAPVIPDADSLQYSGGPAQQANGGNNGASGAGRRGGGARGAGPRAAGGFGRGGRANPNRRKRGGRRGYGATTPSALKYYSPSPSNLSYAPTPKEKRQLVQQRAIANQTLAQKKFNPEVAARIIGSQFEKGLNNYLIEQKKLQNTPTLFQEMNFHYSIDANNQPRRFLNPKGR